MVRIKLKELAKKLSKELAVAQKRYKESKSDADRVSQEAVSSWSSAGDREYSQGQAEILKENLESIKRIQKAIESAFEKESVDKVEAPSYVEINLNGSAMNFYLVNDPIHLENVNFLSGESEIGKVIIGKVVDDVFEIKRENTVVRGKIIFIG
ncbi:MAG TPA: hypothetical protein VI819_04170 [Patescibacteria group bacterium]|nr:hypothetical protein [Patescibacteria group bacterium]